MDAIIRAIEAIPERFIDGLIRLGSADSGTQRRFMELLGALALIVIIILWYFSG
jgi:hypothetical protein